ncbi:MAG: hypothetical protein JXA03_04630 [Bacteroidales bacterium]|nr:hypothetical protein [Bacteroidales bacterium]
MEEILITVLNYLLDVVTATLLQLLVLFGPLLLLAFLMNLVAGQAEKNGIRVFGMKVYLWVFGWLGTSVHETGHAVFALIFGHRIIEIKLFSPDPKTGTLGYVKHEYNSKNIYQASGNFFIGLGPILFGTLLLYLLSRLLFSFSFSNMVIPSFTFDSLTGLSSLKAIASGIADNFRSYVNIVFTGEQSKWWKILLLIYLLYAIGSSITLSGPDVRGSARGFLFLTGILLAFNLATLWIGGFTLEFFRYISAWFSGFYFLIILAMMVNLVFAILLGAIARMKK